MTQKCKMMVLKQIDPVVLPPKKGKKIFQLNRTIIEVTLINDPLVTFWISVCPKINILSHDGKQGHFFKVYAWKTMDLVVYHTRIVYNFFSDHRKGYWSHTHQWPFSNIFLASTGWFFTLASLQACTIKNSQKFTDFLVSTKNKEIFNKTSWIYIFWEFFIGNQLAIIKKMWGGGA